MTGVSKRVDKAIVLAVFFSAHDLFSTFHELAPCDLVSCFQLYSSHSYAILKLERWISLAHAMQNAARDYDPSSSVANIDVFFAPC